jgi:hypothetical protein
MLAFEGEMMESITRGDGEQKVLLAKAATLCGGLDNLAYVLDARTEDLCKWIAGAEPVPDAVIREALVVVSSIRNLPEAGPRGEGLVGATGIEPVAPSV